MIPNVPTEDFKTFIEYLQNSHINFIIRNEITLVFKTHATQSYFQFNNKYLQKSGLTMIFPLNSLLTDIFMLPIENQILNSIPGKNHVFF